MRRLLVLSFAVVSLTATPAAMAVEPTLSEGYIRSVLEIDCNSKDLANGRRALLSFGADAFPIYERILADPKTSNWHVARLFIFVRLVQADRSRFIDPALKRLAAKDAAVRRAAVNLLGEIGSRKEVRQVAALLWDEDVTIVWAAAEALSKIGGPGELLALDVWLVLKGHRVGGDVWVLSGKPRADEQMTQAIQKFRQTLHQRLEEEKLRKMTTVAPATPQEGNR